MTEATVALSGVIILAVLGVIVKTLDYVNKSVFPQIKTLAENVADMKTAHALTAQQSDQNTARLNGQSAKIDTLLRTSPVPETGAITTVNAPAADVVNIAPAPEAAPAPAPVASPRVVTIRADSPLSAEEIALGHAALDAAGATPVALPVPATGTAPETVSVPDVIPPAPNNGGIGAGASVSPVGDAAEQGQDGD